MPGGCDAAYLTNLHSEFGAHPDYVKGASIYDVCTIFGFF